MTIQEARDRAHAGANADRRPWAIHYNPQGHVSTVGPACPIDLDLTPWARASNGAPEIVYPDRTTDY